MSVHEGAEILSRLGILDSKEESPRRTENVEKKFVDVDIDGSESEADVIFDQGPLNHRIRGGSGNNVDLACCLFSESSHFALIIMALALFATGISDYSPNVLSHTYDAALLTLQLFVQTMGLLAGMLLCNCLTGKWSLTWMTTLSLLLMAVKEILLLAYPVPLVAISCMQGLASGFVRWSAVTGVISFWKGRRWRIFLLLACLCFGNLLASLPLPSTSSLPLPSPSLPYSPSLPLPSSIASHLRVRRHAPHLPESHPLSNATERPHKPEVAIGTKDLNTKAKENENKRNEEKKAAIETTTLSPFNYSIISATTYTTSATISDSTTVAPTTTVIPSTTVTQSTPETRLRTSTVILPSSLLPLPSLLFHLADSSEDRENSAMSLSTIGILLLFFFFTFLCSCRCTVPMDARLLRMNDDNEPELARYVAVVLGCCQVLVGGVYACWQQHSWEGGSGASASLVSLIVLLFLAGSQSLQSLPVAALSLSFCIILSLFQLPPFLSAVQPALSLLCLVTLPLCMEKRLPSLQMQWFLLLWPSLGSLISLLPVSPLILSFSALLLLIPLCRSLHRAEMQREESEWPLPLPHRPLTSGDYNQLLNAMSSDEDEHSL